MKLQLKPGEYADQISVVNTVVLFLFLKIKRNFYFSFQNTIYFSKTNANILFLSIACYSLTTIKMNEIIILSS